MAYWTWIDCEPCTGGGMDYCPCEAPCEHDRLCGQCWGYGLRPMRVQGLDCYVGFERYPTRSAVLAEIER